MKKILPVLLAFTLMFTVVVLIRSGSIFAKTTPTVISKITDEDRVVALLNEMKSIDISKLAPLPAERFVLPPAGVDVMRVRLEETYEIKGVGRDTVELVGWIAAKHDNARAAEGETEVKWGTAVVDTEFVGLELRGHSKVFGPVLIRLDPNHRSLGQVGKLDLPFVEQIALDASYRHLRPSSPSSAVSTPDEPEEVEPQRARRGTREDQNAIREIMQGVWKAIGDRDAKALLQYYAPNSRTVKGGEEEVARQFANVRSITVIPKDDLRIRFLGRFANVTATGRNEVVDNEGNTGSSQWKANVQLRKEGDKWLITQDRTSLLPNRGGTMGGKEGKCLAKISVEVQMPNLHLSMKTKAPVSWYSEVETIPPIGYTASVSTTSTAMISNGREVATLEHGAIKFREIVQRIRLEGTNWGQLASNR